MLNRVLLGYGSGDRHGVFARFFGIKAALYALYNDKTDHSPCCLIHAKGTGDDEFAHIRHCDDTYNTLKQNNIKEPCLLT